MSLLPVPFRRPLPAPAPEPLLRFEQEGFRRAADLRGNVAALPTELARLLEEHKDQQRHTVLPGPGQVLEARRAVALAEDQIRQHAETLDRRLLDLDERLAQARQRRDEAQHRVLAAEAASLPDDQPDPLLLHLKGGGVAVLGLFLLLFYLNSVYLGFFPPMPTGAGGQNVAQQAEAYLNATALFRPDLAWQAIGAVFPLLAAGAVLTLALVLHAPTVKRSPPTRWTLVLGTLVLDGLLAHGVHQSAAAARHAMNLPDEAVWYLSPAFYLILAFGFGMAMLFSLALDNLFYLRALRQPAFRHQLRRGEAAAALAAADTVLDALRDQGEHLREEAARRIGQLRQQITRHEAGLLHPRELLTYEGRLRAMLENFQRGWLRYGEQAGLELAAPVAAYAAFRAQYFTAAADGVAARAGGGSWAAADPLPGLTVTEVQPA